MLGALRAGATGLLLKDADPGRAAGCRAGRGARRRAARAGPRDAGSSRTSCPAPSGCAATPAQLEELTAREREVVALVACGLSNEEIAEQLVVTRATAKTHVSRALCKLHARDRAQLVVLAYEAGLVRPGRPVAAGPAARRAAGDRPLRSLRAARPRAKAALRAVAA